MSCAWWRNSSKPLLVASLEQCFVDDVLTEVLAGVEEALAAAKEASGNQAKEFHEQREVWQGELFESERRAEEAGRMSRRPGYHPVVGRVGHWTWRAPLAAPDIVGACWIGVCDRRGSVDGASCKST